MEIYIIIIGGVQRWTEYDHEIFEKALYEELKFERGIFLQHTLVQL
jgi:hypothetical protein